MLHPSKQVKSDRCYLFTPLVKIRPRLYAYKLTFYRDSRPTAVSQNWNQQPSSYICVISYTTNTYVTSLDYSKRIRMKYPGHFKFLDLIVFSFNTYYNGIDSKHVYFEVGRLFIFFRVGRFVTSYLRGLTLCDDV